MRLYHAALGLEGQLVAEVGVRDGNEVLHALAERQAAKLRDAVLRDDIVHVVLAGGAQRTGGEDGLDLAYGAALAVEVKAMKLCRPLDWHAPRTKSTWPPVPERCVPMLSAQT